MTGGGGDVEWGGGALETITPVQIHFITGKEHG